MIATIEFMEKWFPYYNNLYFNNELPTPTFELMTAKTTLGQFQRSKRLDAFANPYYAYFIRLSTHYCRTEHDLAETLVHEMVHEYIAFKNIQDNGSHGRMWKAKAAEISAKSDFDITRTTSVDGCDVNPLLKEKKERSVNNEVTIFGYYRYGKWFTFCVGATNVPKYKSWIEKNVNNRTFEKAFIGIVKRTDGFDDYSLCRTKVRGFFKTNEEFNNMLPNIKVTNKWNF